MNFLFPSSQKLPRLKTSFHEKTTPTGMMKTVQYQNNQNHMTESSMMYILDKENNALVHYGMIHYIERIPMGKRQHHFHAHFLISPVLADFIYHKYN